MRRTVTIGTIYEIPKNCETRGHGQEPIRKVKWRVDQIYEHHVVGTVLPYGYPYSITNVELMRLGLMERELDARQIVEIENER